MSLEIGAVAVIMSSIIGCLTFFLGRQSVAHKKGEHSGELNTTIKHMVDTLNEVRVTVKQLSESNNAIIVSEAMHKQKIDLLFKYYDEMKMDIKAIKENMHKGCTYAQKSGNVTE